MLELAKIVGVNPHAKTVDVQCVFTHRGSTDVPLLYQNAHPDHAGGDDFMPEEGAYCYVAYPNDSSPPFLLGFVGKPSYGAAADDAGNPLEEPDPVPEIGYGYNRARLDPGDRRLATADGNHITLRRGGIVEISSTPLAQIMLVPIENVLRFYAQRFQMRSPLGEIDWGHVTLTADGTIKADVVKKTPVLVKHSVKETAQQDVSEHYTLEVRSGQLDAATLADASSAVHRFAHTYAEQDVREFAPPTGQGVLSVGVFDHSNGNAATFLFQVRRTGDVYVQVAADIFIHAANVYITANTLKAAIADLIVLASDKVQLGSDEVNNKAVARKTDAVKVTLTPPDIQALVAAMAVMAGGGVPPPITVTGEITAGSAVVFAK